MNNTSLTKYTWMETCPELRCAALNTVTNHIFLSQIDFQNVHSLKTVNVIVTLFTCEQNVLNL